MDIVRVVEILESMMIAIVDVQLKLSCFEFFIETCM